MAVADLSAQCIVLSFTRIYFLGILTQVAQTNECIYSKQDNLMTHFRNVFLILAGLSLGCDNSPVASHGDAASDLGPDVVDVPSAASDDVRDSSAPDSGVCPADVSLDAAVPAC